MVVSEGGDGGGIGVDCSVGTIVWVRRRNGSWWPGRILGPEELSASHLMSPRSGTPVKLLGREDASVDWYNLEKSKRVKAFRCGEFDDCIEKAEASLGVPIKKREKYARREDAILHALELERKQLELKQQKQAIIINGNASKPLGDVKREFNNISSSDTLTRNNEPLIHDGYDTVKSPFPEEQKIINSMNINDGKDGQQGGVKDVSEGLPRMRGLQDFGLRIASKKKLAQSSSCLNTKKPAANEKDALISSGNIVRGMIHVSSGKNSFTTNQKISDGGMLEESLIKKRDRRRPLLQVLQTSAKLEAPYSSQLNQYPLVGSFQGEKDHRVSTCRAKRSRCIYLSADSVGPQDDRGNSSEETQTPDQLGMDNCLTQPGSLAEAYSFCEMSETDESDSCTRDYLETEMQEGDISGDGSNGMGVSKWHMKGKRNIRNVVKMPVDVMDGKVCVSGFDKCVGSERETSYVTRSDDQGLYQIKKERHIASDEVNLISEDFFQEQISGYKSRSYRDLVFNDLERNSHEMLTPEWEADELSHLAQRKYWEESEEFNDPGYAAHASRDMTSILFDVNLKVKASYQGEHVPLVSLMSRLNGKAIIGHPIQIEILDDGSTTQYLCGTNACPDENNVQQPVWRTARRTAMQRVPRSNPLQSSLEDDEAGGSRFLERQNKCSLNVYSDQPKNQSRIAKNKVFHAHQQQSGKFQKSLKRLSLSSQKTRTLSSFTSEKRFGGQDGNPEFARGRGVLSGLMKPEGQVPSVTCVPVKVAFSRILEAIGRPSSMVSHHVRMATSSNNRSIVVKQLCASRG